MATSNPDGKSSRYVQAECFQPGCNWRGTRYRYTPGTTRATIAFEAAEIDEAAHKIATRGIGNKHPTGTFQDRVRSR